MSCLNFTDQVEKRLKIMSKKVEIVILPVYGSDWKQIDDQYGNKHFFRFIERSTREVLEILSEYQSKQDHPKVVEITINEQGYTIPKGKIKGFHFPEEFFQWWFERIDCLPDVRIYQSKFKEFENETGD
jgi:hypothetical protein